ncbi:MAG: ATP:cob(I)alamin adenosyltransferase, partial [Patescibacteria group bacterium]|nr:ATP:cob(I)alamin adenosyltransferase [Patescibacteria group bacterium]
RAERRIIAITDSHVRELAPETKAYMNRLSSLLFALARLANHLGGVAEETPHY